MADIEDAVEVLKDLTEENVLCYNCIHFTDNGDPKELGYSFPCRSHTGMVHGQLPIRFVCDAEPSRPQWAIFVSLHPYKPGEQIPDVIECRNFQKKASLLETKKKAGKKGSKKK